MLISLWATVTNAVPVSVFFVFLVPFFALALPNNRALPVAILIVLTLYVYFALSTALYAPESFLDPNFYRRDGNFFVTFMPVLLAGLFAISINIQTILRRYVLWAALVNLIFLTWYAVTGSTPLFAEPGVYHMLFEAHNAAGGYLATLSSFALGIYVTQRKGLGKKFWLLVTGSILLGLFLTDSRGSEGAMLCAIVLVFALKERFSKTIILGLAFAFILMLAYFYPHWVASGKPFGLVGGLGSEGVEGKDANVLQRLLYLWPRAVDLFIQSPIFGAGFGSYNDVPYQLVGIPYIFAFNHPSDLVFDSAHAHNTYLHVLAETGAVGFCLLMAMLVKIRQSINQLQPVSVQLGLKLAFWVAIFSSLTEHRLFTPAQMLPFTIVYGLAMANHRWNAAYRRGEPMSRVPAKT